MRARLIDGLDELRRLGPGLAAIEAAQADPFLSSIWLESWYTHFTLGDRPVIVAIERPDGSLAGLAPLLLTRVSRRRLPVRILRTALRGSAGPARSGIAVAPGDSAAVVEALIAFLSRDFCAWDWLEFEGIESDGELLRQLGAVARARRWSLLPPQVVETARILQIERPWDDFIALRGRHFRRRMGNERNRLDRFRWSLSHPATAAEIAAAIPAVEYVLCQRYKLGVIGDLPDEDRRSWCFLLDIVERFATRGQIDLRLLYIEDMPAAFILSLVIGNRAFPYITKYAPAYESASPGRAVINALIADAQASGFREIDFLSNWSYLSRFTDQTRKYVRLTAFHPGWYSRMLGVARRYTDRCSAPAAIDAAEDEGGK